MGGTTAEIETQLVSEVVERARESLSALRAMETEARGLAGALLARGLDVEAMRARTLAFRARDQHDAMRGALGALGTPPDSTPISRRPTPGGGVRGSS